MGRKETIEDVGGRWPQGRRTAVCVLVTVAMAASGCGATSRGRPAASPPGSSVSAPVIGSDGTIGTLRFGHSTRSTVQAVEGTPDATANGTFSLPGTPSYMALGYQCSSTKIPRNQVLTYSNNSAPYCLTIYYLDATTGLLAAFATGSTNFRTTSGTTVAMTAAEAQDHEKRPAHVGCVEGIYLSTTTPATVFIQITSPSAAPNVNPTDLVTNIQSEPPRGGVGLLSC